MKYLIAILFILALFTLFGHEALAGKQQLTVTESGYITKFSDAVMPTMGAANQCDTELILTGMPGNSCEHFADAIIKISNLHNDVLLIKPNKRRWLIVAMNDKWYSAFREYDKLVIITYRINERMELLK